MSTAKPVVLCGKEPGLAAAVIEELKPEYDVIALISSISAGTTQLPTLLSTQSPSSPAFHHQPLAIITGGGFSDSDVTQMMQACGDSAARVPWLRPDISKKPPGPPGPGFAKFLVPRMKVALGGVLGESEGGNEDWKEGRFVIY